MLLRISFSQQHQRNCRYIFAAPSDASTVIHPGPPAVGVVLSASPPTGRVRRGIMSEKPTAAGVSWTRAARRRAALMLWHRCKTSRAEEEEKRRHDCLSRKGMVSTRPRNLHSLPERKALRIASIEVSRERLML